MKVRFSSTVPNRANQFTRGYEFPSSSVAAGVILGRTANGYVCWADMGGTCWMSSARRSRAAKRKQDRLVPLPVLSA